MLSIALGIFFFNKISALEQPTLGGLEKNYFLNDIDLSHGNLTYFQTDFFWLLSPPPPHLIAFNFSFAGLSHWQMDRGLNLTDIFCNLQWKEVLHYKFCPYCSCIFIMKGRCVWWRNTIFSLLPSSCTLPMLQHIVVQYVKCFSKLLI